MILAFLIAAPAASVAQGPAPATVPVPDIASALRENSPASLAAQCASRSDAEILVCSRKEQRYRIDPAVIEASRAAEAPPVKPPLAADAAPTSGCVGPTACKGGTIPLIGMALVVAKAVALAANGDDWRDAIRTHEDEYRLYKEAEERKDKERRVRVRIATNR